MFSKIRTITLAAAAVAALGAATLITSSADARGFGGGFHAGGGMHVGGGMRFNGGMRVGHINNFHRPVFRPGFHRPGFNRIPPIKIGHRWPRWHWHHCHFFHHCHWRGWGYGVGVIGAVGTTGYAVAPAQAAASPAPSCTCLTKQYTPDNLVVFQDVCTKEVASAPIGNTQVQLQAPEQQQQQQ